jgi:polyketide biosynthesis acyl carrier protein
VALSNAQDKFIRREEKTVNEDRVFDSVRRNVAAVVPELNPGSISIEDALADLGCTSVDRADIIALTMEELGITVPVREFEGIRNIRALVNVLARHV